jgi:hypothetical protein
MDDWQIRFEIYRAFADTGRPPAASAISAWAGGETAAQEALHRLHDARAVVLDADGAVRMALPFSALPTDHCVVSGTREWWANCAWDALAIPVTLGIDAAIDARWHDTGEPVELDIVGGALTSTAGFVHFTIPARHWWVDIVET